MNYILIVNPIAGNKKNEIYAKRIEKILIKNGIYPNIFISKYKGHITEYIKNLDTDLNYTFYSIGGDGTLNEVVNGIENKTKTSSIVIVPCGTGNDFIKIISKYKSMRKIILESLKGTSLNSDLIKIQKSPSAINILSAGFDAQIAKNVDKFRWIPFVSGKFKYNLSIIYTMFSAKNYKMKIRIDNKYILKGNFTLIAVANGKYYGGGIIPCPDANISDSKLDICIVKSTSFFKKLMLLPKYKKGKHTMLKECDFYKAETISIVSTRQFPANTDGEVYMTKKLNVTISKNTIKFIAT